MHQDRRQDQAWRIQRIPAYVGERGWLHRINPPLLVGVGLWTLAFSAFFTARVNLLGFIGITGLALIVMLGAQRPGLSRRRQVWTLVEARCLDRELRLVRNSSGEGFWQIRVLCEFLYDGQLWHVTPDTAHHHFPSEAAAQAFLSEHIGDDQEMTLYVNPRNPLNTML